MNVGGDVGPTSLLLPPSAQPELCAPVSAVLRTVLLERVVPTRGGYAIVETLSRARIVCAVLLILQLATVAVRWWLHAKITVVVSKIIYTSDLIVAASVTTHCIFSVAAAALEPSAAILAYHTVTLRLDKLLEPGRLHAVDVKCFNRRLVWVFVPKLLYLAVEAVAWTIIYGFKNSWPHYGDSLCKVMSDLAALSHAIRLIEVENRTSALERTLRQAAAAAAVRQRPSTPIQGDLITFSNARLMLNPLQHSAARECYLLLCEMFDIVNKTFAFQVVICFVRSFILMTTVIHQLDSVLTPPQTVNLYTDPRFVSAALLSVVVYMCEAVQVVVIAVLQVEHAASVVRLYRDIVLHAETLAAVPAVEAVLAEAGDGEDTRMFWNALAALCHRRPLRFTACGFFNVDYSLLVTMFGAVVTYTVLLIQMNDFSHQDSF